MNCFLVTFGQSEEIQSKNEKKKDFRECSKSIKVNESMKENIDPCKIQSSPLISFTNSSCFQEKTNRSYTPPKTPKKHLFSEDPVTPNTNFKLLTSLAASRDYASYGTPKRHKSDDDVKILSNDILMDDSIILDEGIFGKTNRKEKSLALICEKFFTFYPLYPSPESEIIVSLDEASQKLGVERRRIYDIVNVLESVEILKRKAKNQYQWFGKTNLLGSLLRLKSIALNEKLDEQLSSVHFSKKEVDITDENFEITFPPLSLWNKSSTPVPKESRKERSLGIMSQKFLMLYLVFPARIISLDTAAKILSEANLKNGAQLKTKIRRLYDIANIFSSMGLVRKVFIVAAKGKKPAFKYTGPDLSLSDMDKKNEYNVESKVLCSIDTKKTSRSLVRHSSLHDICAVAEIERQKLSVVDNANSCPPFSSSKSNEISTSESLHRSKLHYSKGKRPIMRRNIFEVSKSSANAAEGIRPLFQQQNDINKAPTLKIIHFPSIVPNNLVKVDSRLNNGTSASKANISKDNLMKISTGSTSSNHIKKIHYFDKVSQVNGSPKRKVLELTPSQCNIILKSLNMSLSPGQAVTIQLEGTGQSTMQSLCEVHPLNTASHTNSQGTVPQNELPLKKADTFQQSRSEKLKLKTSLVDLDVQSRDSNSTNNSPTESVPLMSPLSIPSGYVTPIISGNSNLTFPTNSEVNEVLQNLECQQTFPLISTSENSCDKLKSERECFSSGNTDLSPLKTPQGIPVKAEWVMLTPEKKPGAVLNVNSTEGLSETTPFSTRSADSSSTDSLSLEVTNIFKSNIDVKQKPYLIDEKTILSPIRKNSFSSTELKTSLNLITPPHFNSKQISLLASKPIVDSKDERSPILSFIPVSGFCSPFSNTKTYSQEQAKFIFPTP